MFALSHLFYPWGIILQAIALVHFVRRRPEWYWFWIIVAGGFLGALAYMAVEMAPDTSLLRDAYQRMGRRKRIQQVETAILDNPSAGNYEELGELYLDQKEYANAREALSKAIAARRDSPHAFYRRGQSALAMGDFVAAIPDLEQAVRADAKMDFYRAASLLADAYGKTGRADEANRLWSEVTLHSSTPETLYNYAWFLKSQNRLAEAREWTDKLKQKKRTLPRYMQRIERPWFRKGKALEKDLAAS